MGGTSSKLVSEDVLDEYVQLTYLSRVEILKILFCESHETGLKLCDEWDIQIERRPRKKKQISSVKAKDVGLSAKEEIIRIMQGTIDRLHSETEIRFVLLYDLDLKFGFLLDCNPYRDRLLEVFSSYDDSHMSFEDMLDLFSALSENCPDNVKARWAFKIFDFDGDNLLSVDDLKHIVGRLCESRSSKQRWFSGEDDNRTTIKEHPRFLTAEEKTTFATKVISEMDMDNTGSVTPVEFVHAIMKIPDFASSFTLKP
ncbi:unnamed protein product [Timema podura]|uniref:EF-hand domain-containing protein n=1 Tax=Timema podura TaxID=61482 RepID=A0ABN7NY11_TIMPD|nr:unnamed protein product [Timema podura]